MAYGNRKQTINKVDNSAVQGNSNCAKTVPGKATEQVIRATRNAGLNNKLQWRKCNKGSQSDGKGFLSNGTNS